MTINETIEVSENEGLSIEVSRIKFADGYPKTVTWFGFNFKGQDLIEAGATITEEGNLAIDEDTIEIYIQNQLNLTLKTSVTSFRWTWDKYRTYKA